MYCDKCWIKEFFLLIYLVSTFLLTKSWFFAWLHHGPLYLIIVNQVWNASVWSYLVALRTYHQDLTNHSKFFGSYEDHSNYGKWKCFFVIAWLHYISVTYESKTLVKLNSTLSSSIKQVSTAGVCIISSRAFWARGTLVYDVGRSPELSRQPLACQTWVLMLIAIKH